MTTQEIYKLANEFTEQEANNIIAGWERDNDTRELELVKSLQKLGDSLQMAVATAIAEKINYKGDSEMYNISYN